MKQLLPTLTAEELRWKEKKRYNFMPYILLNNINHWDPSNMFSFNCAFEIVSTAPGSFMN